mgnify:CR=1 FL=1
MTVKETLENHIVIVVLVVAVGAFGSGWLACERVRVAIQTEKISDLEKRIADQSQQIKDSAVAIEPYQKQIADLLSSSHRLETDLNVSQGNLVQWQQALHSWKDANEKLQNNLKLYASNCSVISLVRAVEEKKESAEHSLANAYHWDSEKPRIEDYKRQVSEYQSRLVLLHEKLACVAR